MNRVIAEASIRKHRALGFTVLVVALIGFFSLFKLGQLEDPEFTIRTAVVITQYPGADAHRVEQEVTEVLEREIQQLGELDELESFSREGVSVIYVHVGEQYGGEQLRQIWDELRKKVFRASAELPGTVRGPLVNDEFGDVYSSLLSVTGDGYSYAELRDITDFLRQELLRVDQVGKVEIFGDQGERVFLETSRAKIAELGLTPNLVVAALQRQNVVAPGGMVDLGPRRLGIYATGVLLSVEELAELAIRSPVSGQLIRVSDFAEVHRGYAEPPEAMLRFNGEAALSLGVVPVTGANIVDLNERIQATLGQLNDRLPVGVEVGAIALQADQVEQAIGEFVTSLVTAVLIVIGVLMLSLGFRTGLIVSVGVPLTIMATFLCMFLMNIDLHRVSLGALVIVLGMLVDNAIVVSELIQTRMRQGVDRLEAITQSVAETFWPLLSATLIAILAFSPIVLTQTTTGEFTRSLFWVVAASLLISWVLAMTFTPLLAHRYLKAGADSGDSDGVQARFYEFCERTYHRVLAYRAITLTVIGGAFLAAMLAFTLIPQIFFPPAQRAQFLVDYWLPEGSRIEQTANDMSEIETFLLEQPGISNITSFIGEGAPRFYLPMIPEPANPAFGQILVNLDSVDRLDDTMQAVAEQLRSAFPDAQPRVRAMQLGEPVRFPLQLRVTGPDQQKLRDLASELGAIMAATPGVADLRDDWRQARPRITIEVDQDRARRSGVSSTAINEALNTAFAGQAIGVYHEDDKRIPIIWRFPLSERADPSRIGTMVVWPDEGGAPVPLAQMATVSLGWGPGMIWRHDRERAVTLQADLHPDQTAANVQGRIDDAMAGFELPAGYRTYWDGEVAQAAEARAGVLAPVPVVLGLMILVLMFQFNSYRKTLLVMMTVPLGVIGVTAGLLAFNQPFGFMALLGTMSLSGMIIRNAVVMIEQIELEQQRQQDHYKALVAAAISRVRPIVLTTLTTVLGLLPLALSGPFWAPMAIAIMAGLGLSVVLTLVFVPVGYAFLFKVQKRAV
ncbi:efflux RND transporter permease subunit [Marinobacter halophilus]|uniref:AcrB/AcrD/AcrF family protein n=1 Tax=Marinobacter halophilus TaxID=1323740 RepID=A0A2T1KCY9_9GAMM|nr:efflux RND transporter permease subunit [Marinobacter halophilus]PSF07991.1 AcrB/AcrD/AcrF family protein [Marinobacter halophilus]GGC58835.1 multidrug transporter AcrB [Marinobacter halophilus]